MNAKKTILWILPIFIIIAVVGYLVTRTGKKDAPEEPASEQEKVFKTHTGQGDARGDGTGQGRGRGGRRRHAGSPESGELKLEVFRDGTLFKTIDPGDLESIPKDPRPVLSNRVRSGWELKKLIPEVLGSGVTRISVHSSWGDIREVDRAELADPEMIFFFSQSKKGNLNFFPIDLRQTHMIPAGRKASRIKKIMLRDVRKIEIFSGGKK